MLKLHNLPMCVAIGFLIVMIGTGCHDEADDQPDEPTLSASPASVSLEPPNTTRLVALHTNVEGDVEFHVMRWTQLSDWLIVQPDSGMIHDGTGYLTLSIAPGTQLLGSAYCMVYVSTEAAGSLFMDVWARTY